jgi:chromosomal replication initiator protein
VPPELEHIWALIQSELRRAVTDSTYEIWLAPLRAGELDGDTLVVTAPDEIRTWVSERFGEVLLAAARTVVGEHATVEVVAREGARRTRTREATRTAGRAPRPGADQPAPPPATEDEPLNPKFTFDQFVLGDSNRLAHAAALSVAELPGQAYNPLFIYGPPGVGKTHLLHSIGNYVRAFGAGLRVRYTTVERFTNEFIAALQAGGIEAFKHRFRDADVLLIDDVQFLISKARTEEEFFHTFNALYDAGSQLVLTSDRLPRDLDALEDRLRERFESGLVTDIQPPDVATRMTVLRKRIQHDGVKLDDDSALEVIARRIPTNIRALEGALIRVVAFHSLTRRPITPELAEEVLDGLYPTGRHLDAPAPVDIARIQELTCEQFAISRDELLSDTRTARIAWPRQVAMYLAREHTSETLPAIGQRFGGRNHTTVMHACKRTSERIASDPDAYEAVRLLTERLRADRGS